MAATFQATTPEIAGLEKERAAETQALTERLGPLESQKNTAFQELDTAASAPMPERPQLQQIPTYKPAQLSQETMVNFGSLAMAFAALAGMRTRQPLTAAMNAAGAAMNGFSQGNIIQVKQDLEVFRTQSANALATNRQMMEEYNAILADRRMNFAEKQARWRAAADTWGDEITKSLLRVGSLDKAIQLQQHRLDAQNSWEQNARNTQSMLDARYAEMAQRERMHRESMDTSLQTAQLRGQVQSPMERQLGILTANDLVESIQQAPKFAEQAELAQQGLDMLLRYSRESPMGTGPIATIGGLTRYASEDTQKLEALFRQINLKNMAATFQGMSRAIDTQAERAAWERTQPGVALDDAVNANILLGSIAIAKKAEAEAKSRQQHLQQGGSLLNYESPILGKTKVMWDTNQRPHLVPMTEVEDWKKQGLMDTDQLATKLIGGTRKAPSQWDQNKEQRYQELLRKRNAPQ